MKTQSNQNFGKLTVIQMEKRIGIQTRLAAKIRARIRVVKQELRHAGYTGDFPKHIEV